VANKGEGKPPFIILMVLMGLLVEDFFCEEERLTHEETMLLDSRFSEEEIKKGSMSHTQMGPWS
jgi:hypothetical protein